MEDKPLLDGQEPKRPIILYVVIALLSLIIIILSIVIATKECNCEKCEKPPECPECPGIINPYNESHFVPIKGRVFTNRTEGSSRVQGELNHFDSPYFKMLDIYNMESNENRTILTHFKTYQQTSEFSGHCAVIIMALNYYGYTNISERECLINGFGVVNPDNMTKEEMDLQNVETQIIIDYIESLGFNTTSSENYTEDNYPFKDEGKFYDWVKETLEKNETILVYWSDWGGTLSIIVGIDNMGNKGPKGLDRVLILADTYDTCDHLNDGYYVIGFDKFFINWQKNRISYLKQDIQAKGRFIVIHRKDQN